MKKYLLACCLLLACSSLSFAADAPADTEAKRAAEVQKLVSALKLQTGEITLHGGIAKITLPASLRYLDSNDTDTVLTKIWGNPKGDHRLGMLVPANFDPRYDSSWAVVVTFEEDGYVKDDDAAKIDYTKLLADMKEQVREASKERQKEGYEPIELVGWAAQPHYDAVAKKLYWAKELKFGDSAEHTLNYNLRLLGRRGVLVLNAVAGMNQLKVIESVTPTILAAVNFQEGHRYADFNGSTDKVATYGVAALVAGGIAAKAGLFKGLWIAIIALKKFVIIFLIALAGSAKKLWAWITGRMNRSSDAAPPAAS
jgi:uncharacterized membrane-anchored protein